MSQSCNDEKFSQRLNYITIRRLKSSGYAKELREIRKKILM